MVPEGLRTPLLEEMRLDRRRVSTGGEELRVVVVVVVVVVVTWYEAVRLTRWGDGLDDDRN